MVGGVTVLYVVHVASQTVLDHSFYAEACDGVLAWVEEYGGVECEPVKFRYGGKSYIGRVICPVAVVGGEDCGACFVETLRVECVHVKPLSCGAVELNLEITLFFRSL